MEFREATKEDFEFVANHSISHGISKYQPECIDYAFTLEHDGVPLGIGGFRLINSATAWCWVDMADTSGKHIIIVYRVIKEWIEKFAEEHKLKRLQAYIKPDFPEAIRMVQHLGFERESNMEGFLPDGDAFMYKRIL